MTKWMYETLGMVLLVIFVCLMAPDISYVRSLLAAMTGWAAIWLIGRGASSEEDRKIQAE
jgi:hypothetical protein